MDKKLIMKRIFTVIAIPIIGYILLNLTFLFCFLFQSLLEKLFITVFNINQPWFPKIRYLLFLLVMAILSWFILKCKIKDLYKAIFSHVPIAIIFVTIGMFLYQMPVVSYVLGALIFVLIALYLYMKKKPWYFYYVLSWLTLTLLIMSILGMDI